MGGAAFIITSTAEKPATNWNSTYFDAIIRVRASLLVPPTSPVAILSSV